MNIIRKGEDSDWFDKGVLYIFGWKHWKNFGNEIKRILNNNKRK